MSSRDKHLLEVFKDLGSEESPPAGAPEPSPAQPGSAQGAHGTRRRSGSADGSARGRGGIGSLFGPRTPMWIGVSVVIALVAGYWLGSGSGAEPVQAADPGQDPLAFLGDVPAAEPEPVENSAEGASADAERVFADMATALAADANDYTVVAITYDNNENNERLAWSTVYHFAERGLPVGPPYGRGGLLYILVGAAPSVQELAPLRDRVRVQLDPGGRRRQYETAYVSRIDQVLSER